MAMAHAGCLHHLVIPNMSMWLVSGGTQFSDFFKGDQRDTYCWGSLFETYPSASGGFEYVQTSAPPWLLDSLWASRKPNHDSTPLCQKCGVLLSSGKHYHF